MVRALPPHPSLEHLKGQAKALHQALKQGDPKAKLRFGRCFDVESTPCTPGLTVCGRESVVSRYAARYGFVPPWLVL